MKTHLIRILTTVGVIISVAIGSDVVARLDAGKSLPTLPPLTAYPARDVSWQIVSLGNSHAESGIDFSSYALPSHKLSNVAQRFSLDLAQLRQYRNQIAPGALILIPVSPISFAHRPVDQADTLQTVYYDSVSPFFIPGLNVELYVQTKLLPFLQTGPTLRHDFAKALRDRIALRHRPPATPTPMPTATLPYAEPTRKGSSASTAAIRKPLPPPHDYDDNLHFLYRKWLTTDEFDPTYFAANQDDLQDLISFCVAQGWRPILLTIPISNGLYRHLQPAFFSKYLYDNLDAMNLGSLPFFDFLQHPMNRDYRYFANADHLNSEGATVFSYVLLSALIEHGLLDTTHDSYDGKLTTQWDAEFVYLSSLTPVASASAR